MNTVAPPPRAGRREWIGLAVIALPCLLYSMDLTVLNLAVPSLSADLKPSSTQLLWIIDIYGFLVAGSLITMGTLGDRIGRRRLLLIGAGDPRPTPTGAARRERRAAARAQRARRPPSSRATDRSALESARRGGRLGFAAWRMLSARLPAPVSRDRGRGSGREALCAEAGEHTVALAVSLTGRPARAALLLLPDLHLAEAFHRFARTEVIQLV